jgi:hypothetical protein
MMSSENSPTDQPAFSGRDIAKAVEGFNRAPGLSPTARRLGIELVGHVNKQTFRCDPSEARLAHLLGVTSRAIRKAKQELQRQGLLTWRTVGQNGTCNYHISWKALARIGQEKQDAWRKFQEEQMRQPQGTPVPVRQEH